MTQSIFIGPAGWSYRDWNGVVYPPKQEKGFDPLAFVSFYFNLIEINSTFYRTPDPRTARNWVKRVAGNPEFLFTAKAHQNFTHARGPISQTELDAFMRALAPIHEEGKLGFVLVQFPWSFRYSRESKDVVDRLATALAPLPVAFEVRHGSWAKSEAIAYFRELGVTLSGIDQPVIGNSLTPKTHIEGPNGAYFRLHGRNAAKWFDKDSTRDDRYDYLYSTEELSAWVTKIQEAAAAVHRVFVVLNNHFRGQAASNALELKAMLSGQKVRVPATLLNRFPNLRPVAAPSEPGAPGGAPSQIQGDLFETDSSSQNDDDE